jgi:hypothetical protein
MHSWLDLIVYCIYEKRKLFPLYRMSMQHKFYIKINESDRRLYINHHFDYLNAFLEEPIILEGVWEILFDAITCSTRRWVILRDQIKDLWKKINEQISRLNETCNFGLIIIIGGSSIQKYINLIYKSRTHVTDLPMHQSHSSSSHSLFLLIFNRQCFVWCVTQ